jgi:DNA-binding MarR family transcriptional regulator
MKKEMNASKTEIREQDYQNLAAFRHALREFLHFSEEAASKAGVPPHQHQALLAIRGWHDGARPTIGELAERLKVRHHSMVGLISRMEADGLITKRRDPENGRRVLIDLKPKGLRVLERLSPTHLSELARIGPSLRQILKRLEKSK